MKKHIFSIEKTGCNNFRLKITSNNEAEIPDVACDVEISKEDALRLSRNLRHITLEEKVTVIQF